MKFSHNSKQFLDNTEFYYLRELSDNPKSYKFVSPGKVEISNGVVHPLPPDNFHTALRVYAIGRQRISLFN